MSGINFKQLTASQMSFRNRAIKQVDFGNIKVWPSAFIFSAATSPISYNAGSGLTQGSVSVSASDTGWTASASSAIVLYSKQNNGINFAIPGNSSRNEQYYELYVMYDDLVYAVIPIHQKGRGPYITLSPT